MFISPGRAGIREPRLKTLGRILLTILFLLGITYLIQRTWIGGSDFRVYYNAVRHWVEGDAPYSVLRDGTRAYKYPPWTLPVFLPFLLLNEASAIHLWAILQGVSLFSVFSNLGIRAKTFMLLVLCTYGVILSHFILGQVILPIVALCLFLWVPRPFERSLMHAAGLSFILSFKIFPLWVLGFDFVPTLKAIRRLATTLLGLIITALAVAVILGSRGGLSWVESFRSLMENWGDSLTQGNAVLGVRHLYGGANQGLPALIQRGMTSVISIGVPQQLTVGASIVMTASALTLLRGAHKRAVCSAADLWLTSLALIPVLHPLSWPHMFVFALPLGAIVLEGALVSGNARVISNVLPGLFFIVNITSDTLGSVGGLLDEIGIKSWGVLLLVNEQFNLLRRRAP